MSSCYGDRYDVHRGFRVGNCNGVFIDFVDSRARLSIVCPLDSKVMSADTLDLTPRSLYFSMQCLALRNGNGRNVASDVAFAR